jgi:hypothetical protein
VWSEQVAAALLADGSEETRHLAATSDAMLAILHDPKRSPGFDPDGVRMRAEMLLNGALAKLAEIASRGDVPA